MRNIAAASALLAAGLCITAATTGTAGADTPEAPTAVNYTATTTPTNAVIKTDSGSIVVDNGVLKIEAADGTVLAGTELAFRVDDFVFPIAADVSDNTATLTPQFDVAHASYEPIALPFEDQAPWKTPYDREQAAWTRLASTVAVGATVGTALGGIAGAALGCAAGAAAGVALTGALLTLFGSGPLAGCLGGAAAVGFIGTFIGQLLVTAPVAIGAALQYFTTINQPFVATK